MFLDPEQTLIQLARIFHGLKNRSHEVKTVWQESIADLYYNLPAQKRKYLFTRQLKSKYSSSIEFAESTTGLSVDTLAEIHAALVLIEDQLDAVREYNAKAELSDYSEAIISSTESDEKFKIRADEYKNRISESLEAYRNRKTISIPTTINILLVDYLLRWIVLWIYQSNDLAFNELFYLFQVVFIPGLILLYGYIRSQRNIRHIEMLVERYGGESSFRIKKKRTTGQYTVLAFLALSGIFIAFGIHEGEEIFQVAIPLTASFGFLAYYSIYLWNMSTARMKENDFFTQKDEWKHLDHIGDPDRNDEIIVEVESRFKAVTSRLDAYVLESAILGALSFSGFLQIMAENLISFEDLAIFGSTIYQILTNIVQFQPDQNQELFSTITGKTGLFSMVAIETLLCSLFFLTVITARLKFSNIGDRVDYSLNVAKAYNDKEEVLLEKKKSMRPEERMKFLSDKIKYSLLDAIDGLNRIQPINSFIQYFRNAGLATFFIILVSCSLFISGILAWIFSALAIFILVYFSKNKFRILFNSFRNNFNSLFINYETGYFVFIILITIIGYICKYYRIPGTSIILFFDLIIFALLYITQLIIIPVEGTFSINKPGFRSDRWSIMKWIWSLGVFLVIFGISFKVLHFPGANGSLTSGLFLNLIACIYFLTKISKKDWVSIGVGSLYILTILGMLGMYFSIYPGLIPGLPYLGLAIFPAILIIILKYKKTHPFLRLGIVMLLLVALILVDIRAQF